MKFLRAHDLAASLAVRRRSVRAVDDKKRREETAAL
jgi:hypothetical protein